MCHSDSCMLSIMNMMFTCCCVVKLFRRIATVESHILCYLLSAKHNSFLILFSVVFSATCRFNSLIATLNPQSCVPSYSNTVIGTLAAQALPCCSNTHPSTASVQTLYYSMWHYNCLWSLKIICFVNIFIVLWSHIDCRVTVEFVILFCNCRTVSFWTCILRLM